MTRRTGSSVWRVLAGAVSVLFLQGCALRTAQPARSLDVTLTSASGFALSAGNAEPCVVTRARLHVREVRGDTVFFREATDLRWPPNHERCRPAGSGLVVVREHEDLRAQYLRRAEGTVLLVVVYTLWSVVAIAQLFRLHK